ncbi:MAG: glycosyltransferase family 4 protein [Stigonema ocellatum SAG 48.90 = DSM 106950]|nr:glycosyltransferase family 4 protein [Stigonema ocellatum SAG 48.90 = DSM 106950]
MKTSSKIHIGVLYIGRRGGICHYTYELVRVISKMTKVTCYLSANNTLLDAWRELPCDIKTFDTYNGFTSLLWSMISHQGALRVAREIDIDAPDILLDTGSGPWLGIIQKNIGCKTLLVDVIHDVKFHSDKWLKLLQAYEFIYPRKADVFIGLSKYSYKQLSLFFPSAKHIHSLHGIIHASCSIDLDKIARNRNNLLFFGRIEKYKGIEILIDAFRIAKQNKTQLSLTIVGAGLLDAKIQNQIAELKIKLINRWISDENLPEIIARHGVMIMPYLSATQSGVAGVALGNGLPCIGTNVGALPEQIIHGRNGLIVEPGDANALAESMLTISRDYMLAYKMAQEACLIASTTYSWKKIGSVLLKDLENLVTKN